MEEIGLDIYLKMKNFTLAILFSSSLLASAQEQQTIGGAIAEYGSLEAYQQAQQQQQLEARQIYLAAEATRIAKIPNQYRVFGGRIYNLKFNSGGLERISADVEHIYTKAIQFHWKETRGIFERHSYGGVASGNMMSGGVVSHQVGNETVFEKQIIVLNYPATNVAEGQKLDFSAMKIGTTNFNGSILELWDCGVETDTPPPEEIAAKAAQEKAKAEAKAKAELVKKTSAALALQSNLDAAAKGDLFGLLRMGERYRDGDGVEKNLSKAREYLQKAADAGSPTAQDELTKLP